MGEKKEEDRNPGMRGEFNTDLRALGMIETRGLVACIEAADAMAKAANIVLMERRAIGGGYMTVMARGNVGSVRTALEAGARAAQRVGEVVRVQMLPSPHQSVEGILPDQIK